MGARGRDADYSPQSPQSPQACRWPARQPTDSGQRRWSAHNRRELIMTKLINPADPATDRAPEPTVDHAAVVRNHYAAQHGDALPGLSGGQPARPPRQHRTMSLHEIDGILARPGWHSVAAPAEVAEAGEQLDAAGDACRASSEAVRRLGDRPPTGAGSRRPRGMPGVASLRLASHRARPRQAADQPRRGAADHRPAHLPHPAGPWSARVDRRDRPQRPAEAAPAAGTRVDGADTAEHRPQELRRLADPVAPEGAARPLTGRNLR
jgi:hypothetical protein